MLKISKIKYVWAPSAQAKRFGMGRFGNSILTFTINSNDCGSKILRYELSGCVEYGFNMQRTNAEPRELTEFEIYDQNLITESMYCPEPFYFRPDMINSQLSELLIASAILSLIKIPEVGEHAVELTIPNFELTNIDGYDISIFTLNRFQYERLVDVIRKIVGTFTLSLEQEYCSRVELDIVDLKKEGLYID